ncbi:MAG: APC family permease [Methanofollis sp.]|uniref:APC family permease n=1 Tax=Methanofollis sp. TaxID=2052835 RepID=UPI00261BF0C2|nr:APC family permease [Methanofollis sp.]MDD4254692.1 APC family permease [Methanofollis sp.]
MERGGQLKRALGLPEVTLSGVGIILGAGIYALMGEAAGLAGNAVWVAFGISAVMAACTGLAYAELSSMFPRASAEYAYVGRAFGQTTAFLVGWLILASGVLSAATVALGFGGYISSLAGIPAVPAALLLIAGLAAIGVYGIRETALFAIAMTLIEAGGIVFVIVIGIPYLGSVDYFAMPKGLPGVFQASALVFFAYMGFEEMVKLAEETREPERTIPRALLLALAAAVVLYMLVTVSAVSVLGWEGLAATPAPFAAIADVALGGSAALIISLVALCATANTSLLLIVATSRLAWGMAGDGALPAPLAQVHPAFGTPWAAVAVAAAIAAAFTLTGEIAYVANATNFALFLTFALINATVVVLRLREPDFTRPFRVPLAVRGVPIVPLLGILFSFFLLLQIEAEIVLLGLGILFVGWGVSRVYRGGGE